MTEASCEHKWYRTEHRIRNGVSRGYVGVCTRCGTAGPLRKSKDRASFAFENDIQLNLLGEENDSD